MTKKNTRRGFTQSCFPNGFTLIELLVVVLIIGILAAVAVPQYQKAVEKSRAIEGVTNLKTIQNSVDIFLLENGFPQTSVSLEDLDAAGTLQGGFFDEDGRYHTNNFMYSCWGGNSASFVCEIHRSTFDEDLERVDDYYSFLFFKGEKTWYGEESATDKWVKLCVTQNNDMGRYICHSLENQGFVYIDNEV